MKTLAHKFRLVSTRITNHKLESCQERETKKGKNSRKAENRSYGHKTLKS